MENQNNTNQLKYCDGYNVCPRCGRKAYAVQTEDGMYYVGCLFCGFNRGNGTYTDDMSEKFRTARKIAWNQQCIEAEYSAGALENLGMTNGDYVMVRSEDKHIIHRAKTIEDVKEFWALNGANSPFDIYALIEGSLQYLGNSYFLWLLTET